jgi:hypothetical protein
VSNLVLTPIGTCRIHTPLRRAAERNALELNLRRNYGFGHTCAEALQLVWPPPPPPATQTCPDGSVILATDTCPAPPPPPPPPPPAPERG